MSAADRCDDPMFDSPIYYAIEEAYDSLRPLPETEAGRRRLAAAGSRPLVSEEDLIDEVRDLDSWFDRDEIRRGLEELVDAGYFTTGFDLAVGYGYASTFIPISAKPTTVTLQ